jgi:hypothetical protein
MSMPRQTTTASLALLFSLLAPYAILPPSRLVAAASQVNVTVDDSYGDSNTGAQISYNPPSSWNTGQTCEACTAHPDAGSTFDSSWHDATYYPVGAENGVNEGILVTASYSFTGTLNPPRVVVTNHVAFDPKLKSSNPCILIPAFPVGSAIYVYCILTGSSISPDGNSDMSFAIDGETVGTFQQTPSGDGTYLYDQLVYSKSDLLSGEHNFTLTTGSNNTKALVILDRLVYTYVTLSALCDCRRPKDIDKFFYRILGLIQKT